MRDGLHFSQYAVEIDVRRDLSPFLMKNLLPLMLLVLVLFVSLWLPATELGTSASMCVSAIISTAVLLSSVTSTLPSVSYLVALEWGYYAFILLAVTVVFTQLVRKRLAGTEHMERLRRVSLAARVGYVAYVLTVFGAFLLAHA